MSILDQIKKEPSLHFCLYPLVLASDFYISIWNCEKKDYVEEYNKILTEEALRYSNSEKWKEECLLIRFKMVLNNMIPISDISR